MKRKLIAFALVFTMLASLSTAVTAEEVPAQLTIEEILNDYHQQAFEAQTQSHTDTASTWSRSGGNTKTLVQDTVDTLVDAGYEAYNVSVDNYENLEVELKTDFATMGLDPEGSYIFVVSGEESKDPNADGGVSTFGINPLPGWDQPDGGDNSPYFYYTYEGTSYLMRYVTVTNADTDDDELFVFSSHLLSNTIMFSEIVDVFIEYALSVCADNIQNGIQGYSPYFVTIGSVVSLLGDVYNAATQSYIETLDPGTIDLRAGTAWTRSYIQVYNESDGYWYTTQSSSYAISEASFYGDYVYDSETNRPVQVGGVFYSGTVYSPYYNNTELRKTLAVNSYKNGNPVFDHTGDIEFYFTNPNSNDPDTRVIHLFTHEQNVSYRYPSREED